jgi:hypothetical protein
MKTKFGPIKCSLNGSGSVKMERFTTFSRKRDVGLLGKICSTKTSLPCIALTLDERLFTKYRDGMGHFHPCIIILQNVNAGHNLV